MINYFSVVTLGSVTYYFSVVTLGSVTYYFSVVTLGSVTYYFTTTLRPFLIYMPLRVGALSSFTPSREYQLSELRVEI